MTTNPTMPDWIPCTDRLPPNGVEVSVKIDRGFAFLLCKMIRRNEEWFFGDESRSSESPTHWKEIENAK